MKKYIKLTAKVIGIWMRNTGNKLITWSNKQEWER